MSQNRKLTAFFNKSHDIMRNNDGLQPQESFNELLKYIFFKIQNEINGPPIREQLIISESGEFSDDVKLVVTQIKKLFKTYVKQSVEWITPEWKNNGFILTDTTLFSIHRLFDGIKFKDLDIDTKSLGIRSFLTPEIRRGLGIFLTPEEVVRFVIRFINPVRTQNILDPACGSGTFLTETVKFIKQFDDQRITVWGIDKNPRMLLLANINLNYNKNVEFKKYLGDCLFGCHDFLKNNFYDVVMTNPPFGVSLDGKNYNLSTYQSCHGENGSVLPKQKSEIVFLEQCLKLLKPGGKLGIVLPKSVITNSSFKYQLTRINKLGFVIAVVMLPAETFQIAGTQTTTIVLFMQKYQLDENPNEFINIGYANITNVGYDSTGREKKGNQLINLADDLKQCISEKSAYGNCITLNSISKGTSLIQLNSLLSSKEESKDSINLIEICDFITNGLTPPRAAYEDNGLFILKVGNITGNGINWRPRERNFVNATEKTRRYKTKKPLLLQEGDIVMTSSAHAPKYIAEKIDIISTIPGYYNKEATFVGEVMLIRVKKNIIDPYLLLAFLRNSKIKNQIREFIRGQTAHLYPEDIGQIKVPVKILKSNSNVIKLIELLKQETILSEEMNQVSRSIDEIQNLLY